MSILKMTTDIKSETIEAVAPTLAELEEQRAGLIGECADIRNHLEALNAYKGGLSITLEGADNVGKTTTIGELRELMEDAELPVQVVREPGGTAVGEMCRVTLKNSKLSSDTEFLLMHASRMELLSKVINPAIMERQCNILADRSIVSSVVYQAILGKSELADLVINANRTPTTHLMVWLVPDHEVYAEHLNKLIKNPADVLETKYKSVDVNYAYDWLYNNAVVGSNEEYSLDNSQTNWALHNMKLDKIDAVGNAKLIFEAYLEVVKLNEAQRLENKNLLTKKLEDKIAEVAVVGKKIEALAI